jgi:hypothetical protein
VSCTGGVSKPPQATPLLCCIGRLVRSSPVKCRRLSVAVNAEFRNLPQRTLFPSSPLNPLTFLWYPRRLLGNSALPNSQRSYTEAVREIRPITCWEVSF